MKTNIVIIIAILCLIAGGAIGYLIPTQFIKSNPAARGNNMAFANGQLARTSRTGTGAGANGGLVTGQLLKIDKGSLSVKLRDGSSRLVITTPSTQTLKMTTGTVSDLTVGEDVVVSGIANSDGSVTAQSVQIRPAGAQMFGNARPDNQPTPPPAN